MLNVTEVTKELGTGSGWREATVLVTQINVDNSSGDVERPRRDRGHQHNDTDERSVHTPILSKQFKIQNGIDKMC